MHLVSILLGTNLRANIVVHIVRPCALRGKFYFTHLPGSGPNHMPCHIKVYEIVVNLAKFYGLDAEEWKV